jgi:homocysteine S-methyltransferase
VNCVPADRTRAFVSRLARIGVPFGAYANAGDAADRLGWSAPAEDAPARYAAFAREWEACGATILGGCCGTGPAQIAAVATLARG